MDGGDRRLHQQQHLEHEDALQERLAGTPVARGDCGRAISSYDPGGMLRSVNVPFPLTPVPNEPLRTASRVTTETLPPAAGSPDAVITVPLTV